MTAAAFDIGGFFGAKFRERVAPATSPGAHRFELKMLVIMEIKATLKQANLRTGIYKPLLSRSRLVGVPALE
jgi:hypothetical protein